MRRQIACALISGMVALSLTSGSVSAQSSSALSGVSNAMNPAISVNGLFWGQVSPDNDLPEFNRVALQEAEAQLTAVVDPFWKAKFTFALHPAHAHAAAEEVEETAEDHEETGGFELDVEEAWIDATALPAGFGLRLGRFYLPFGKHNPLHTHQFPFATAPLAIQSFLGDHPVIETGGWLAATVPLPWYSDLKVYGVNGTSEIFNSESRDLVWGGRWENLWDVSDTGTFQLGGSAFTGPTGHPGEPNLQVTTFGVDVMYKWVSGSRSQGPALVMGMEALAPRWEEQESEPFGWYSLIQYRFHRNWWLGMTMGYVFSPEEDHEEDAKASAPAKQEEHHHGLGEQVWEYKANLVYAPSEFSSIRAEVDYYQDRHADEGELRFILQVNFTIGSHPAHLY